MALGDSKVLCLVPTAMERDRLLEYLDAETSSQSIIRVCGFGLVASGIETCRVLDRDRPDRVLLLGIAGAYRDRLAVGSAHVFKTVSLDGIGVGEANQFTSAATLGWREAGPPQFALACRRPTEATAGDLLSVAAASGNTAMADRRANRPNAPAAEDMEGYAVAMACHHAQIPLTIIRGISNRAGDRDHRSWAIAPAMQRVAELYRLEVH